MIERIPVTLAASTPVTATGRKDDGDKLRYDLLPLEAERLVVAVLTYGAQKYAPDNWRVVPDARARYHAAARRHLAAWASGEKLDPESGHPHLAHAVCCLMFLLENDAGPGPVKREEATS